MILTAEEMADLMPGNVHGLPPSQTTEKRLADWRKQIEQEQRKKDAQVFLDTRLKGWANGPTYKAILDGKEG